MLFTACFTSVPALGAAGPLVRHVTRLTTWGNHAHAMRLSALSPPVSVTQSEMDYTIRRSARARHIWLRFSSGGELVVVVPGRFDVKRVPGVIEENRDWIHRTASRIQARSTWLQQSTRAALPAHISLPAVEREWRVEYRPAESNGVTVSERPEGTLVLSGNTADRHLCRDALLRWLHRTAHKHLVPLLVGIADECGFSVSRTMVRAQRTRWASCSRHGTISLNLRLLFLPPELVRHVILHELCHTRRMDHSRQFWSLLTRHDPGWHEHRRRLRAAWRELPQWLNQDWPGCA